MSSLSTVTQIPRDMQALNREVIDRFYANKANSDNESPIALLTTTGRVSSRPRTTPVVCREDDGDLVVAATMGGSPDHPQWYKNLVADPVLTVEYRTDIYRARATTVPDGPERERLFEKMSEVITDIYRYQERCRATRQIPIIRLQRLEPAG